MDALTNFFWYVAHVRLWAIKVNILMQDDLSSRTNVPIVLPVKSQSDSNLAVCNLVIWDWVHFERSEYAVKFPNRSIKGLENLTGEYGDRDIYGCGLADKQDFEVLCAHHCEQGSRNNTNVRIHSRANHVAAAMQGDTISPPEYVWCWGAGIYLIIFNLYLY